MARVTVAESQRDLGRPKGLRVFNFDPGKLYHVLFLGEKQGDVDVPILYMNYTHNVRKGNKGFEVRCANQHYNLENVSLLDENGELLIDPRSGRPFNDGTCPYCEIRDLNSQFIFEKREEWIKNNPQASKADIKDMTRKLFQNEPVTDPAKRRVMLIALFELDEKGKPLTDADGNKVYSIQGMRFSDSQFNNKLMDQVEIKKMNLEDETDGGLAWHEYYFKYPKAENKMISGKDMSITPVSAEIIESDPNLRAQLEEEVANLDLDELENALFVFKLKTLEEMERDIAPMRSRLSENMSDQDIEEALEELEEDDIVDDEEIADIMGEDVKGEASFDVGISEEEIDNLM